MAKFMTKKERERISNRLVLNFGILLCGALVMLYVYNFVSANYVRETVNFVGIVGILSLIGAILFFVLGKTKMPKIKNYSAIFLGVFIAALITYTPRFGFVANLAPAFTVKTAIVTVFLLMLAYYIVLAIVCGIMLKTHPEAPVEKQKIHHAKKKGKRKR